MLRILVLVTAAIHRRKLLASGGYRRKIHNNNNKGLRRLPATYIETEGGHGTGIPQREANTRQTME
jgi:hypothetical protein